uniref:NADH-ubiquinone oxidoreductase chain 6 n=1 Tax=Hydrophilidae sp. BMNH 1274338 TaxID=1796517 RepID=A0A126TFI6_9COLE|nr:NADH dehydrogenase subunit 6 [Hydrophilidae sp. BMNH 1274338]
MTLLISLSMITSMYIMFTSHPMSMGMILLLQVTFVSLMTGMMSNNFWFSYILFIIMVGGMLVLFIYMTSIASNEKFKFSKILLSMIILLLFMMIMITFFMDNIINEYSNIFLYPEMNINMNKYINFPYNIITIMMILYLLISLIAIVKISKIKYGPLRHMN